MQFRKTMLAICGVTLMWATLFVLPSGSNAQFGTVPSGGIQKGYKIAQYGYLDTDLQFSEFFTSQHTISAWVMPEFTFNSYGAIFSVKGSGSFVVGQGDYRLGNGGYMKPGDPVLWIKINNQRAKYLAPGYKRRKWNHIAVVRTFQQGSVFFALYLNGQKMTPFNKDDRTQMITPAVDITGLSVGLFYSPTGTLRIGRTNGNGYQFHGLVDDVAIYNKAMSAAEIQSLMNSQISGSHPNLVAGYTFDQPAPYQALPLKLRRPVTPMFRAFPLQIPIGNGPRSDADALWFFDHTMLSLSTTRILPFPKNQVWRVTQEMDALDGSHNGESAFSWDLSRVDGPAGNAVFTAAQPGEIHSWEGQDNGVVRVKFPGTDEVDLYMHTEGNSFWQVFIIPNGYSWSIPPVLPVQLGQQLAMTDIGENHLHFSVSQRPGSDYFEIPSSFRNYQLSTDYQPATGQGTWTTIQYGYPRYGEFLRRIE